jgi:peptidoglycan/xylan/chitin deacetylase (PgdA/CDA1 family)
MDGRGDQLIWSLGPRRFRILCYHGVVEDEFAEAPWIPHFFVTRSAFERQLAYLRRNATVLPLSEACGRLRNDSLPARAVSITFDDGYANNLHTAYPLLRQFGLPATIFLSSAYIESGQFYPFLQIRLIRLARPDADVTEYKPSPLDDVMRGIRRFWPAVEAGLSDAQRRILRPMTIEEVGQMNEGLVEFGAHTHTHCILSNESHERRRDEIRSSVAKVRQWTGKPECSFSYPNGQRGDYGEFDKQVLRGEGIDNAVSGMTGANTPRTDMLELRRYPVGLFHDDAAFLVELMGVRRLLRAMGGRG